MAHAAPVTQMNATQMKATARVQSEAMLDLLKSSKLHIAMSDVRCPRRRAAASLYAAC